MPMTPEQFDTAVEIGTNYLNNHDELYVFDGFVGADTDHRLGVRVFMTLAWHALFSETLFIEPGSPPIRATDRGATTGPSSTPAHTSSPRKSSAASASTPHPRRPVASRRRPCVIFGSSTPAR